MNRYDQVHGERPLYGTIAKILFPAVAAALIAYLGMFVHNASHVRQDVRVIGRQIAGAMVVTGMVPDKSRQIVWPKAVSSLKSDKGVFFDAEAAGDIADAELAAEDKNSSEHMLARLN